jgi:serine/threonine-protein kinase RsbT
MIHDNGLVELRVPIESTNDVVVARQRGRALAAETGFSTSDATLMAAAISELARNIVKYAGRGEILLRRDTNGTMTIIARDEGPGILDVGAALRRGYSTSGGLGLGLPGVRRIAESFHIASSSAGTTVTVCKCKR